MTYSADQVLQIAMFMEQMGKSFYQSLAVGCNDKRIAVLSVRFAAEEQKHFKIFENMRNALPANQKGVKMTEDQIFGVIGTSYKSVLPAPGQVRQVAIWGDVHKALDMAIKMESDSINFYKNAIPILGSGADTLKAVIREEEKHLAEFQNHRKNLTP